MFRLVRLTRDLAWLVWHAYFGKLAEYLFEELHGESAHLFEAWEMEARRVMEEL